LGNKCDETSMEVKKRIAKHLKSIEGTTRLEVLGISPSRGKSDEKDEKVEKDKKEKIIVERDVSDHFLNDPPTYIKFNYKHEDDSIVIEIDDKSKGFRHVKVITDAPQEYQDNIKISICKGKQYIKRKKCGCISPLNSGKMSFMVESSSKAKPKEIVRLKVEIFGKDGKKIDEDFKNCIFIKERDKNVSKKDKSLHPDHEWRQAQSKSKDEEKQKNWDALVSSLGPEDENKLSYWNYFHDESLTLYTYFNESFPIFKSIYDKPQNSEEWRKIFIQELKIILLLDCFKTRNQEKLGEKYEMENGEDTINNLRLNNEKMAVIACITAERLADQQMEISKLEAKQS